MGDWKSKWFSIFMAAVLLFGGLWPGLGLHQVKAAGPTIIYVKIDGNDGNDGTSWTKAVETLQQALDKANAGNQIWMAAGTYYPTGNGAGRDRHFEMKNDVALYGGFAGDEDPNDPDFSLDDRNYTTHKTILSGDFDGSDANKAYHVFFHGNLGLDQTAIMDGVTITGGQANGAVLEQKFGAGMYNSNSSPTLTNVTISGNLSYYGGGMYSYSSSPTLTNVTISGNTASYGGGMFNVLGRPTLTNVTISGNTVDGDGGGMYSDSSSPTLTNVTISGNKANFEGSGMYNQNNSNPNIRNSIVWGNTSGSGYNVSNLSSNPIINHSLIEGSSGSGNSWDTAFGVDGLGNIDMNPMFQDIKPANTEPTTEGNYRLRSYSPAIDTGNKSVFDVGQNPDLSGITTDLDKNPRIVGAQADMGAYEYQTIIELKVSPALINLRLGTTTSQQLLVTATLSNLTTDDVTSSTKGTSYTSGDITVATVTANGLLEAKMAGTTSISIVNNGIMTTVQVNVISIAELEASPDLVNLRIGQTDSQQLTVTATLSDTTTDDVTSSSLGTTYTSVDSTVATVTANGFIEAKKVGTTTITIANSGITTTVQVNVTRTSSSSSGGGWVPSGDIHLRELIVRADGKALPLTPAFDADTTQYGVETTASQVGLTGIAVHPSASVTLQGKALKEGLVVDLHEGDNILELIVKAENGTTKTYTLTVKRIIEGQEPTRQPPNPPASFTDIDGHWAKAMIREAATKGILTGYPDGTFRPNHSVTRAEFVTMLAHAIQSIQGGNTSPQNNNKDASLSFTDAVTIGAWAKEAVMYAVQAGIVNGYKDGSFRPNAQITRTELVSMIARALGLSLDTSTATPFADAANIPTWAKGAVEATRKLGIVSGRGGNLFVPLGEATRAETVVLLLRMLEYKGD